MAERLSDEQIVDILEETGAVRHGHFVLTSGRHSDTYVQCARLMESPTLTVQLAEEAAARLPEEVRDAVTLVASPAVGGITFGFAMGYALGRDFIFSERVEGAMTFRRSFEVPQGAKVLVCEDVVTTGGSVKEVCDLVEAAGGEVVGVVSLIDRGSGRAFDAPFYPLLSFPVASWAPEECQLCKNGGAPESLGSRRIAR
ncbi:orotate phosphoribosyltransferase [Olsenella sp. YH-ols2217]|uniref:Orotate phosphoribosyltransferase n=1 Tax=Kribbibacterium absianum TaxID=3044210 RepID=A0ABT6ZIM0_9ACTN|nr:MULTISPECIES: orotate phosphoribosyltransferase [unclassified Olsenella]MDJ1121408.1 orotate phosphoribosyltransferase [Olsenella sp. YH-ols2216]MDJ1128898.1 orotate phosphoribosyltransferase [Olsenella sp. YH-ols2217]